MFSHLWSFAYCSLHALFPAIVFVAQTPGWRPDKTLVNNYCHRTVETNISLEQDAKLSCQTDNRQSGRCHCNERHLSIWLSQSCTHKFFSSLLFFSLSFSLSLSLCLSLFLSLSWTRNGWSSVPSSDEFHVGHLQLTAFLTCLKKSPAWWRASLCPGLGFFAVANWEGNCLQSARLGWNSCGQFQWRILSFSQS